MTRFQTDLLDLRLGDCMDLMRDTPDGFFDLAIVDPPYGIGIAANPVRQAHAKKEWDAAIPPSHYFDELFRVSRNQIVWGGNYFHLPPSQGFLIWDKVQPEDFSLAMCEKAWSSFEKPAKMFRRSVLADRDKIHPTQKPVELYAWTLKLNAKPGQRILDTHLGSGSIAVACHYFGAHLTATEIDPDYFAAAVERIQRETQQIELFPPASQHPTHEEIPLL
jgi:DNA modification methylase